MLYNVIVISTGLMISILLFYQFPTIKMRRTKGILESVSIIIPARNEEVNLSLLLQDLKKQNYPIHEIICVDDCSVDGTKRVILEHNTRLVQIMNKPGDWTGKSWACQTGAKVASGKLLLFLDADVRLNDTGISSLLQTYERYKCCISVQPYHHTEMRYEQFSLFFNLIQIAANGMTAIFKCRSVGLYGPVILIEQEAYKQIGGHLCAKNSIVDDLVMGEKLRETGLEFKLFLGGDQISYRMYRNGILELVQGWSKNYATGASKTPFILFIMVFLWINSCITATTSLIESLFAIQIQEFVIYFLFYILWTLELYRITNKIGKFERYSIVFYPVQLMFFIVVFIGSLINKIFHRNVIWKGRKIKLEK